MASIETPWITGWDTEPRSCPWKKADAKENASFLTDLFGEAWLSKHLASWKTSAAVHPVASWWLNAAAGGGYLPLNALASDLRLLAHAQGFESLLDDLKNSDRFKAAWHTAHCAALFERQQRGSLLFFYPPSTEGPHPDFVCKQDQVLHVEAKILEASEVETRFLEWSSNLKDALMKLLPCDDMVLPMVFIILRNPETVLSADNLAQAIAKAVLYAPTRQQHLRRNDICVSIEPYEPYSELTEHCFGFFYLHILAPKGSREEARVLQRCKDASRQLREQALAGESTLLCLGLNRVQNASVVVDQIQSEFLRSRLKGISMTMLLFHGPHFTGTSGLWADEILLFENQNAYCQKGLHITLLPMGESRCITDLRSRSDGAVACYRFSVPSFRIKKLGFEIKYPKYDFLSREHLALFE